MSEQETTPPSALTEEREGLESEDQQPRVQIDRDRLAKEIRHFFPGVDHVAVLYQAHKLTGDFGGAEDVQQSFYLSLLKLSEEERAAIRNIAAYVTISLRREAVRWRNKHRSDIEEPLDEQLEDQLEDERADFVARIAHEDEANFMLRQIPEHCREAYVYHNKDGYTAKEISELLKVKVETVRKRLQLAALHMAKARKVFLEEQSKSRVSERASNTPMARKESPYVKH
jgi:RNA polymerase sigma factor (sigma-70 family)